MWIKTSDRLPAPLDDTDLHRWGSSESIPVLAYSETEGILFAYYQRYEDKEFTPQWKLVGRDAYTVDGKITHWHELPEPPKT